MSENPFFLIGIGICFFFQSKPFCTFGQNAQPNKQPPKFRTLQIFQLMVFHLVQSGVQQFVSILTFSVVDGGGGGDGLGGGMDGGGSSGFDPCIIGF